MNPHPTSDVRALLFDVFGTVVDWRSGVAREGESLARERGITGIDWLAFADAWRARYQPAMQRIRSGERGFTRLDQLHRENLEQVLSEFGLADLAESDVVRLNFAWHRLDPWPDAVAGLTRLKTRCIIAPLSNGNVSLLLDMARRAGLPWDAILGAEVAGAYKPQPEAYLRTAAILDLRPQQCMMVAAHNGDLAAARACGLRTAFVARPLEHGPGQRKDLAPESDWDFSGDSFTALAEFLGC